MLTLGLDMSSTVIGFALSDGSAIGQAELDGDIAERCNGAIEAVTILLGHYQPALVVIESPVARYARAVIPQARVSGAVLSVLSARRALWHEVAPALAKQVLAGTGNASKREMLDAARRRLGLAGDIYAYKGKWGVWHGGACLLSEDAADAYALALVGAAMKVQVAA